MTTFVWGTTVGGSGLSGDWNTGTLWAGGIVPDAASAAVLIGAPGSYSITIAAGETEIVNTLTLTGGAANLTIDGTLEFAGPLPTSSIAGAIPLIVGATGEIAGTGQFSAGGLVNGGTIDANGGPNDFLEILNTVTNNNVLEIGRGSGPNLSVDAADIILDGQASGIQLFNSAGTFVALEQELGSIAAAGTLALLDGYDYVTGNTLMDAGLILLGGGTLSTGGLTIAAGGTLSAYGAIEGAVFNSGAIIADGGSLGTTQFDAAITGAGTLSVAAGSKVVLAGATLASLADNGVI